MPSVRPSRQVERLLEEAERARNQGDWAEVFGRANDVLALEAGNVDAIRLAELAGPHIGGPGVALRGERRQLTVMFCDVVDSTPLAGKVDAEVYREILLRYQDVTATVVKRYDGHIANYMGDGLLVYFGYPRAHEDSTRRALLAGLEIVAAVEHLAEDIHTQYQLYFAVRVGVHTGETVVGDMGGGQWVARGDVVGQTPIIASRLQHEAPRNTVCVSLDTADLVRGFFDFDDLGPRSLKGVDGLVRVLRVRGETGARSRLEAMRAGLSPMVGRDRELQLLNERLDEAIRGGAPAPVLIVGEAGIGKSRLASFVRSQAEWAGVECMEGQCSSMHPATPFFAVAQMIERACGILSHDDPDTRLVKLERTVARTMDAHSTVPPIAAILGIPLGARYAALELSPEALRALAIEKLLAWFAKLRERLPVLLIFEDVHWADSSTLDLLARATAGGGAPGSLTILTSRRQDHTYPWPEQLFSTLSLEPLDTQMCEELVLALLPSPSPSPEVRARLIERSNGVPLFLEELVKTYAGGEAGSAGDQLPPTLRDLLTERLEANGVDKQLAQVVATVGMEASLNVLSAVAEDDSGRLERDLDNLVDAGVLENDTVSESPGYRFRHALVRDAAYASQLLTQRKVVHGKVAEALERGVGGSVKPGLLATHYASAERWDRAVSYYTAAATEARQTGSTTEAVAHCTAALSCITHLPEGMGRDALEVITRLQRVAAYVAAEGYHAPSGQPDFAACRVICRRLGPNPLVLAALTAMWGSHTISGELDKAVAVLDEAAEAVAHPALQSFVPEVQICQGVQRFFAGQFRESLDVFNVGIPAHQERMKAGLPGFWPLPNDPAGGALAVMGPVAWMTGDHQLARSCIAEGIAISEGIGFPVGPFTLGFVLFYAAYAALLSRDYALAEAYGRRSEEVGNEFGFESWTTGGVFHATVARALAGSRADAQQLLSGTNQIAADGGPSGSLASALASVYSADAEGFSSHRFAFIAEVALGAGEPDLARQHLDLAMSAVARGERYHLAEILRLQAETELALDPTRVNEATRKLVEAVETARSQGAVSLELRAALALYGVGGADLTPTHPTERVLEALGRLGPKADTDEVVDARRRFEVIA